MTSQLITSLGDSNRSGRLSAEYFFFFFCVFRWRMQPTADYHLIFEFDNFSFRTLVIRIRSHNSFDGKRGWLEGRGRGRGRGEGIRKYNQSENIRKWRIRSNESFRDNRDVFDLKVAFTF